MNDKTRFFAFLMAALVTLSILFSYNYISAHTEHRHHCTDDDCPICAVMDIAFRVVSQVKTVFLPVLILYISFLFIRSLAILCDKTEKTVRTLVSQKVELLN